MSRRRSELRSQFLPRQARGQLSGSKVRSNKGECIMMGCLARRSAGTGIMSDTLRALAPDILIGVLGGGTFRKAGDFAGVDAIGNPMAHAGRRAAFRIEHQQDKTLGAVRHVRPVQFRRYVLTDTAWIIVAIGRTVRDLLRHHLAVGECLRFQREQTGSIGSRRSETQRQGCSCSHEKTVSYRLHVVSSSILVVYAGGSLTTGRVGTTPLRQ